MKIYVLGSNTFVREMVRARDDLRELGHEGWIHPDYDMMVRENRFEELLASEHADVKRENDYLRVHYRNICASDGILIVNLEKNGISNYIGGNALIEMGQAFVNGKKIFLLTELPTQLPYAAEIECMDPICLFGDLRNIEPRNDL